MLLDKLTNDAYLLHSGHKKDSRERRHLGIAESACEIFDLIGEMRPKTYAILASCLDGSATLRLSNDKKTWRINLQSFSRTQILEIMDTIDEAGVQFKKSRQLHLNRKTLHEPISTKIFRKVSRPIFDSFLKVIQNVGNFRRKWSSAVEF